MASVSSATDWLGRCTVDVPPSLQPPLRHNITTVLYPGFFATMGEASKYTGPSPVVILRRDPATDVDAIKREAARVASAATRTCTSTGGASGDKGAFDAIPRRPSFAELEEDNVAAEVTCAHSPRLLHNVVPFAEAFEVSQGPPPSLLSPLLWGTAAQLYIQRWFFRTPAAPRVLCNTIGLNNMGGYADQAACRARILEGIARLQHSAPDEEDGCSMRKHRKYLVLFGFSRGAATVLQTALKLPQEQAEWVSLVVLEAPFASLKSLLESSSWFPKATRHLFSSLCDDSGDAAYVFPPTTHLRCPIAVISSDGDTRVPPSCSEECVELLRRLYPQYGGGASEGGGREKDGRSGGSVVPIERLRLRRSPHPLMPIGDAEDREAYIRFMEGLYDKYCPL